LLLKSAGLPYDRGGGSNPKQVAAPGRIAGYRHTYTISGSSVFWAFIASIKNPPLEFVPGPLEIVYKNV